MKKALFLILALGLFSNCLAQDLLITAKGKLIRCKILAQTDQLIFISKVQPDGSSISSYVSKDTIRLITPNYSQEMGTLANKTAIPQMNDPIQNGKRKKNRRPFSEVARFALSACYSHLFDTSDESDPGFNGKSGFSLNGDMGGFFNDYLGLGVFANYSHYNKNNIHNLIAGPKLLFKIYNRTRTNAFILGWGLGYNYFQTNMRSSTAFCGSLGTSIDCAYEIGLNNKGLALLFNLNAGIASANNLKIRPENYKIEYNGVLMTINLNVGIVFGR